MEEGIRRHLCAGLIALVCPAGAMAQPDRLDADPGGRPVARAPSLVEVAQLARAMREPLGRPTRIYTTRDLPHARRVTEPTRAWVTRYLLLKAAALEQAQLLQERRREPPVPQREDLPVRSTPARAAAPRPTPATSGIPLSLIYPGVVLVGAFHPPRPGYPMAGADPSRHHPHRHGTRDRRSPRPTTPGRATTDDPGELAGSHAYAPSSRLFLYTARGLPDPRLGRSRARGAPRAAPGPRD